jgi:hypothetical protein
LCAVRSLCWQCLIEIRLVEELVLSIVTFRHERDCMTPFTVA